MADNQPTEIAIAVVEFEDRFLIGERPDGAPLGGYWEFPGGKVEPDESPRDAAARECLEETGLEVTIGDEYPEVVHQYDHGALRLHFFRASPDSFTLPANARFLWVRRDQLPDYRFPEANRALLDYLCGLPEQSPRDLKFWLGPIETLLVVVFAGFALEYHQTANSVTGVTLAMLGMGLMTMTVVNKIVCRADRYNVRQAFFDLVAVVVSLLFAKVFGAATLLVWIPLLLLRRL